MFVKDLNRSDVFLKKTLFQNKGKSFEKYESYKKQKVLTEVSWAFWRMTGWKTQQHSHSSIRTVFSQSRSSWPCLNFTTLERCLKFYILVLPAQRGKKSSLLAELHVLQFIFSKRQTSSSAVAYSDTPVNCNVLSSGSRSTFLVYVSNWFSQTTTHCLHRLGNVWIILWMFQMFELCEAL